MHFLRNDHPAELFVLQFYLMQQHLQILDGVQFYIRYEIGENLRMYSQFSYFAMHNITCGHTHFASCEAKA